MRSYVAGQSVSASHAAQDKEVRLTKEEREICRAIGSDLNDCLASKKEVVKRELESRSQPQPQVDYRAEWIKQLAKNEDLQKKLDASVATIDELEKALKKAQEVQAVSEKERQSMERTIAAAEKAFAVYDKAITVYEKTIENQSKTNEVQAKRIDKLEDKLDRANKRNVVLTVLAFISGAILGR